MATIQSVSDLFEVFSIPGAREDLTLSRPSEGWELQPALAREPACIQQQESKSHSRLKKLLPSLNDWERLAIAQHYGVPTRLLDWSEDPLVGLYFAVADDRHDSEDGVIWVFQDRTGVKASVAPLSLKHPRPYRAWDALRYPIPRAVAQRGSLTSQPDLTTAFDGQTFADDQSLAKYTVPSAEKSRLRNDFAILGVTEGRLFPDLVDLGNNRPTRSGWRMSANRCRAVFQPT